MINTLSIRAPKFSASQSSDADSNRAVGIARPEAYVTISGSMDCRTGGVACPVNAVIIACVCLHSTPDMLR